MGRDNSARERRPQLGDDLILKVERGARKRLCELTQLEERTVELLIYGNHHIHGVPQTEEHARAMFGVRRSRHSPEVLEQAVQARMARQAVFDWVPLPLARLRS